MSKSIFSISLDAVALEEIIFENQGEITPVIETWLEEIKTTLASNLDRRHFVKEKLLATADMMKKRAEQFTKARMALEKVVSRIQENEKDAMLAMHMVDVSGELYRYKLSPTPGVVVIKDLNKIPPQFKQVIQTIEIDKDKLKEALTQGPVEGAELKKGYSLRAYVNKNNEVKK